MPGSNVYPLALTLHFNHTPSSGLGRDSGRAHRAQEHEGHQKTDQQFYPLHRILL